MKVKTVKERTSKLANSKIIATTLAVIACGYLFFFLSNIILPHNNNYLYTPLNEVILLDSRNVTVISSIYSADQQLIELQLDIDNPTYDGIDTYICQAVTRNNSILNVTPVVEENNFLVYHISTPKNFTEISIRLKVDDDRYTDIIKIYTNIDDIDKSKNIVTKTSHEYKLDRFKSNITLYNNQIEEYKNQIAECHKTISNIQLTNKNLKADRKYQTEQEILETNNAIAKNEQRIEEEQNKIKEYQSQISELQEKIKKTEQRISEL